MTNRTCSEPDCDRKHKGRGLCHLHWDRQRRTGSTSLLRSPTMEERFWAKVDCSGGPDACWPWSAPSRASGYGQFHVSQTAGREYAHRVSYALAYGEIPDGLTIDHLCHSRSTDCVSGSECEHRRCVNPSHLEAVTNRENILRSYANAVVMQRAKTHCPQGHSYAEHGFNPEPDGRPHRRCRICQRQAVRKSTAKARAKAHAAS